MFATGLQLGKYELGDKLGEGGFGVVFVGRDTELERDVALKFLHPEHTANPEILRRFLQEARSAAKISHPGIVTVFECGQVKGTNTSADGVAFIAMELLHGESLGDRLARVGRLDAESAIAITRQVASALEAAHRAGIIHRDLKPDNIYLVTDPAMPTGERVKVLDFGIAKLAQTPGTGVKTQSQMIFGTPRYMSPEQCKSAANIDHRSDIYTLGCIVFELVCGETPFAGEPGELIAKHQMVPPPTPRSLVPTLPEGLDRAITKMLSKAPGDRPQTMIEVQRTLQGGASSGLEPTLLPDAAESLQRFTPPPFGAARPATGSERETRRPTPGVATTLNSASGAWESKEPVRRRGRTGLVVGGIVALAALAVAGVGIWFAMRSTDSSPPVQAARQPALPPPPPVPTEITLQITSTPKAEVFLVPDNTLLGETPVTYKRTLATGQIVFLLRADGWKDQRVVMPADRSDTRAVTLVANPPPATPPVVPPVKPVKPVKPPKPNAGSGSAKPPKPGDQIEVYPL